MSQEPPIPKAAYKPLFTFTLGNRTLQLTREGGGFIFLVFGVGLVAINTGNNLLYLVLAMCCSFIIVSGILSELTLKRVAVEVIPPPTLYAGEPYPLILRLTNHKKMIPSFSLRILFPPSNRIRTDGEVYLFHLPSGETVEKTVTIMADQRGWLDLQSCRLSTSFPFGFFLKTKTIPVTSRSVVFPAIRSVDLPSFAGLSLEGEGTVQERTGEIFALREFRPGDSMNHVHWKSTAKTGTLRVKEFAAGGRQRFTLFLNLDDSQTSGRVAEDILEQRVVESASLAYHLIRRGDEVSLKTGNEQTPFGNSEPHLEKIMRVLAFVGLRENV